MPVDVPGVVILSAFLWCEFSRGLAFLLGVEGTNTAECTDLFSKRLDIKDALRGLGPDKDLQPGRAASSGWGQSCPETVLPALQPTTTQKTHQQTLEQKTCVG